MSDGWGAEPTPDESGDDRIRTVTQRIKDTVTFPLRALTLFEDGRWALSRLKTERFDYVHKEVAGYCLDVGCGRHNLFVRDWLNGCGEGIDVFPYAGLTRGDHLVDDIECFPFVADTFDSVTFIASINHVPRSRRDVELREGYGSVIATRYATNPGYRLGFSKRVGVGIYRLLLAGLGCGYVPDPTSGNFAIDKPVIAALARLSSRVYLLDAALVFAMKKSSAAGIKFVPGGFAQFVGAASMHDNLLWSVKSFTRVVVTTLRLWVERWAATPVVGQAP